VAARGHDVPEAARVLDVDMLEDEDFHKGRSVQEKERKRSLFYKKAPQKIFDGCCRWNGLRTAALEAARKDQGFVAAKTRGPRSKKVFWLLFSKK